MKKLILLFLLGTVMVCTSAVDAAIPVIDGAAVAQATSMPADSLTVPRADPVLAAQAVSDGKTRVTRDGRLVTCDATGQAYEVTNNGSMVTSAPIWKAGKPLKCRRDMFAS